MAKTNELSPTMSLYSEPIVHVMALIIAGCIWLITAPVIICLLYRLNHKYMHDKSWIGDTCPLSCNDSTTNHTKQIEKNKDERRTQQLKCGNDIEECTIYNSYMLY